MFNATSFNVALVLSKSGIPCLWESGGGYSNTGNACCIAKGDGSKLVPIFIRNVGQLACNNHALFAIRVGNCICKVARSGNDYEVMLYKVVRLWTDNNGAPFAECILIGSELDGESDISSEYKLFVEATKLKSRTYHCRVPMWYLSKSI